MSPGSLRAITLLLALGLASWAWGIDPHLDPQLVPEGCPTCHRGHGVSRSPMLGKPQAELCLSCHGSGSGQQLALRNTSRSTLRPATETSSLSSVLSQPFVHPITESAFSRHEPGAVTCTSCHSPHRAARNATQMAVESGLAKPSPRNPGRFEYEMCAECHGSKGVTTQNLLDIRRQFSPDNRSYHPVEAPARSSSPSLISGLAGQGVNCTDCHGNSDSRGPRGPHGSSVRFILRSAYTTADGSQESLQTYSLCYDCHAREQVLDSPAFPPHRLHVEEEMTSCATCHSAHGSVRNRSLIRFGEETILAGAVSPSATTGQVAFLSDSEGSGSCYLTCHGYDHAPATYGFSAAGELGTTGVQSLDGLLIRPTRTPGPRTRPDGRTRSPDDR
jgi:predicted CXXCH cytochrome family protein